MATKLARMAEHLNEEFREVLKMEMKKRYGINIETSSNFFTGCIYSTRTDGAEFTPEQHSFMNSFGDGFAAALIIVRQAAS